MKKLLFFFVFLFPTFEALAEYAHWQTCFNRIKEDKALGDKFFGADGQDYPKYFERNEEGNIIGIRIDDDILQEPIEVEAINMGGKKIKTQIPDMAEKRRVFAILFEYMAEKCDDLFADMAREAYQENADENSAKTFRYKYTISPKANVFIEESAEISIYPKKMFRDSYPQFRGFLVTSNVGTPYKGGDIVDLKSLENQYQNMNSSCRSAFTLAGDPSFYDFMETHSQTYDATTNPSETVFPGLVYANTPKTDIGVVKAAIVYPNSAAVEYIKRYKNNNYAPRTVQMDLDIQRKLDDFCKYKPLHTGCRGSQLRVYPVIMSAKTPVTKFEKTHYSYYGGSNITGTYVYYGDYVSRLDEFGYGVKDAPSQNKVVIMSTNISSTVVDYCVIN